MLNLANIHFCLLQTIDRAENRFHTSGISRAEELTMANFCNPSAGVLLKRHVFLGIEFVSKAISFRKGHQSICSGTNRVNSDSDRSGCLCGSVWRDGAGVVVTIGQQNDDSALVFAISQSVSSAHPCGSDCRAILGEGNVQSAEMRKQRGVNPRTRPAEKRAA